MSKKKNDPIEAIVARLEERLNGLNHKFDSRITSLEDRLFGNNGAFHDIRKDIERLEGRQWWLLGTIVLTLMLTAIGILLGLPR